MFYRGDQHADIIPIKQKLLDLGYTIYVDDIYDLDLEIAVSDIQQKYNLTIDHIIGPKTKSIIMNLSQVTNPSKIEIILDKVPYFTQRDNDNVPSGTCNVTSVAMLLAFNGVKSKVQLEDELFTLLLTEEAQAYYKKNFPSFANQGYNARNIHGMLVWLINRHNLKDKFSMKKNLSEFYLHMKEHKQPIITSGLFTKYGHIVLVVGQATNGDLIVHDPWGDWNTSYKSREGKFRLYSFTEMQEILKGYNSEFKYAHLVTK